MVESKTEDPTHDVAVDAAPVAAIRAENLSKIYSEGILFRKKFEALKSVSFEVQEGEIFGLLGPNGAGKTTFIKILLGIIGKTDGDAAMLGHPAGSRAGRRLVGYLPEHLRIPPHLDGNTALEYYGSLSNLPRRSILEKRDSVLELVGLADRAKDRCKSYSKRMLQRLGLAQALLHEPQLLILDEPTDGLDPQARAEMRETIQSLKSRGVTIFLNSHLLQEVEMICERVAILDRGNLRYCGSVKQIGDFVNAVPDGATAGILILLEVVGTPDHVNAAFAEETFDIVERPGDQHFKVSMTVPDQSAVDRLVDRLRQNGVSLLGLSRRQVSLEEAFLQIVREE